MRDVPNQMNVLLRKWSFQKIVVCYVEFTVGRETCYILLFKLAEPIVFVRQ